MAITVNTAWLLEYLDPACTQEQLIDALPKVGLEVEETHEVKDEGGSFRIVLNVLPNRPDCLGLIGIAREVAVLLGLKLKYPSRKPPVASGGKGVAVDLRESQLCPRYTCQLIRGVRVGPSPQWLKSRLLAIGARPINNVVDATNYILYEWGQPLHAFDFRNIRGGRIVVRRMEASEKMELLSGKVIDGSAQPLVIADAERPVALAGIMGGRDAETNEATVDVLLEGACFDPINIRRTSRKLDVRTESSFRYERGTDPNCMLEGAMQSATQLILELAGGSLDGGLTDQYPTLCPPRIFKLDEAYTSSYLGLHVDAATIRDRLSRLEMQVTPDLQVTVPTWRVDVNDPVVLIEDVARLGDYDVIPTQAVPTLPTLGMRCTMDRLRGVLADYLSGAGYFECRNPPLEADAYSLSPVLRGEGGGEGSGVKGGESRTPSSHPSPQPSPLSTGERGPELISGSLPPSLSPKSSVLSPGSDRRIHLTNPSNREMTVLRESLLTGLLRSAERNLRRGAASVRLYEIDRTFALDAAGEAQGRWAVAGVAGGIAQELNWRGSSAKLDFYDLKGIVQNVLELVRVPHFEAQPEDFALYTPGLAAAILVNGSKIGRIGEVASTAVDLGKSSIRLFAFELDLELLERSFQTAPRYQPLARTPGVPRDLAIVVSTKQPFADIESLIRQAAGPSLETLRFADLYRGPQVPPDHTSLAFHLVFRDPARTLTAEDVATTMEQIVAALAERFGAKLRV